MDTTRNSSAGSGAEDHLKARTQGLRGTDPDRIGLPAGGRSERPAQRQCAEDHDQEKPKSDAGVRDVTIALSAAQLGTTFNPRSVAFKNSEHPVRLRCAPEPVSASMREKLRDNQRPPLRPSLPTTRRFWACRWSDGIPVTTRWGDDDTRRSCRGRGGDGAVDGHSLVGCPSQPHPAQRMGEATGTVDTGGLGQRMGALHA